MKKQQDIKNEIDAKFEQIRVLFSEIAELAKKNNSIGGIAFDGKDKEKGRKITFDDIFDFSKHETQDESTN
jgi:hypothetical protein